MFSKFGHFASNFGRLLLLQKTSAYPLRRGNSYIQDGRCFTSNTEVKNTPPVADPDRIPEEFQTQTAKDEIMFPLLSVRIQTCGTLYEKWKKEKRYWTVPQGDLAFDVHYIDTAPHENNNERPIVLALPGSPGSPGSFLKVMSHFHRNGIRAICPYFPDMYAYKLREFRHSPQEKCRYTQDFLQSIGVNRVDMLLCHSSALFPSLRLCLQDELPEVRTLAILNPTAFGYPRLLRPYTLIRLLTRMYEFPVGKNITDFISRMLVLSHKELWSGQRLNHYLSAVTLVHSDIPRNEPHFRSLLRTGMPVFMAFSENDKLISKKELYKMASMMVDEKDIKRYDRYGKSEITGENRFPRKVIAFENGTHFLTVKHSEIIAEELMRFLFESLNGRMTMNSML